MFFVDLFKEGLYFDLLIVLVFLVVIEILFYDKVWEMVVLGELLFDGILVFVIGVLFIVMVVVEEDCVLLCFKDCGSEVVWVGVILVYVVCIFGEVI